MDSLFETLNLLKNTFLNNHSFLDSSFIATQSIVLFTSFNDTFLKNIASLFEIDRLITITSFNLTSAQLPQTDIIYEALLITFENTINELKILQTNFNWKFSDNRL